MKVVEFKEIGTLFEKYEVKFPVDEELVLIHGENGSGKTQTVELLVDYYKNQNENVLYFPLDRYFQLSKHDVESVLVLDGLSDNSIFKKLKIDFKPWDYVGKQNDYITSGNMQMLNFIGSIMLENKPTIVIIDTIEKNLDIDKKREVVKLLSEMKEVKKLISIVYAPETIAGYSDKMLYIENCVKLNNE